MSRKYATLTEFADRVRAAVDAINEDNPMFVPGETQCRWCRARATCRALASYTLKQIQSDFDDDYTVVMPDQPKFLLDHELAHIMGHMDLIGSWTAAVKQEVKSRLERGSSVPGFKLVHGRSIRKWSNEAQAEAALLSAGADANALYTRKIVSVAQAEKLIGKATFRKKCSGVVIKPDGALTVVSAGDGRQEYVPPNAASDFID